MLDMWNFLSLTIFDTLLGWTLYLPSDAVLLSLALVTGGLMVLTRPLATNQNLLARIDKDRRRLNELIAEAKKTRDYQAIARFRTTSNQLALRKLAAEGKPLLVVIVPVALLATWAMFRVEYHPPAENEEIQVVAYVHENTAPDEVILLKPDQGLVAKNGWIQPIQVTPNGPTLWNRTMAALHLAQPSTPEPDRTATWILEGKTQAAPYVLTFRFHEYTIEPSLIIGQKTYTYPETIATLKENGKEKLTTQIKMRPVELFGVVPGYGELLPGWLVGYIIIVVPLVFALKWLFNIY